MNDDKYISIHDGISIGEQKQLIELTRGLMSALTKEEFFQIVGVYNKAINRLTEQAKKEGIDI